MSVDLENKPGSALADAALHDGGRADSLTDSLTDSLSSASVEIQLWTFWWS